MKTWYIKIGNSEIVAWDGDKKFVKFPNSKFHIPTFFKKLGSAKLLWIASVVPKIEKKIILGAKRRRIRTKVVKISDIPMKPAYKKNLGIDRLLNVFAASAILQKGGGLTRGAVIDLGTAITVEFFKSKKHLGGWILPGPRLMAESLAAQTAKLPLMALKKLKENSLKKWPKETGQSLSIGQQHLIRGLLAEVERVARETFKNRYQILVTGGWALAFHLLTRQFKTIRILPYLGLYAMKILDRKSREG
jgi:pantothenate kinase type III